MAGKFSVEGVFSMQDRGSRTLARIESRFDRMQRNLNAKAQVASASMSKMFDAAGKGLEAFQAKASAPMKAISADIKTAGTAAVAAGAAVGAGLVEVMRSGMTFEKTLLDAANKFEPGVKKTAASFKRLSAAAQEVGGSTEFSASQSAMALNDLAGAGFNVEQAISALPKVVNFATAASLDLSAASEVAAKSLGAYAMKSDDPAELAANLQKITDVLMKTDAVSSTSIPALFEVMKDGGPIAAQAGVKLESFMAMAAALGEAGIEGTVAATTLKGAITTLAAPTGEAEAAFKRLGVSTKTASGELRDPIETLAGLKEATDGLKGAEKIGVLEGIFGKVPLAGVSALLADVDKVASHRTGIEGATGQVDLVAASKRAGGTGAWDNLTSAIEGVSLAIFEVVGGPMTQLLESTTEWIGKFKDQAIPFVDKFVGGFRDGFKEAWPAIKSAVDMLFTGFGGKAEWLGRVKDFASVLGKVTAGAAGLAVVLGGMLAAGVQLVTGVVNLAIGAWDGMIKGIGAALFAIDDFFANAAAKWRAFDFAEWGKSIVRGIANGIKSGAAWVTEAITNLANGMIDKFKEALSIHSPSKRMAELGAFAAEGVGVGWSDKLPGVNKSIERSLVASPLMDPINALSLGSDAGDRPDASRPQLTAGSLTQDDVRAAVRDHLEILVRAEPGTAASVPEKPKGAKVRLAPQTAASGAF